MKPMCLYSMSFSLICGSSGIALLPYLELPLNFIIGYKAKDSGVLFKDYSLVNRIINLVRLAKR